MNPSLIPTIRWQQTLCRANGMPYVKSLEDPQMAQLIFAKAETTAISMAFKLSLGSALPPAQQTVIDHIQSLSQGIWGFRMNGMRLLMANLLLEPNPDLPQIKGFTKNGSIVELKGKRISEEWNAWIMDLYQIIECSHYDFEDEVKREIKKSLDQLNQWYHLIESVVFMNQQERESFRGHLGILSDSVAQFETLFPCLLIPLPDEGNFSLSDKQFRLFGKIVVMVMDGLKEFEAVCADKLKKTKKREVRNQLIHSIRSLRNYIGTMQATAHQISDLMMRSKKGDPKTLLELDQRMKTLYLERVHESYQSLFLPSLHLSRKTAQYEREFQDINDLYDFTFLHSFELLSRFTHVLFRPFSRKLTACAAMIQSLGPDLSLRSPHLTPLDLFSRHWIRTCFESPGEIEEKNKQLASIELIIQILRNPRQNIYGKSLEDIPALMDCLKDSHFADTSATSVLLLEKWYKEGVFECVLPWLNAPLLHPGCEKNPDHALWNQLKLLLTILDRMSFQKMQVIPGDEIPEKIYLSPLFVYSRYMREELKQLLSPGKLVKRDFEEFCKKSLWLESSHGLEEMLKMFEGRMSSEVEMTFRMELYALEDLRTIYARPFLSMGRELLLDDAAAKGERRRRFSRSHFKPKMPLEIIPVDKGPVSAPQLQLAELFESLIPRSSAELKRSLSELVDALSEPYLLEPIYQAAARCLEASLQPAQNHRLSDCVTDEKKRDWLKKMEQFLPLTFSPVAIDDEAFEMDMCLTGKMLGLTLEGYLPFEMKLLPETSDPLASKIHDILWSLSCQDPGTFCQNLPNEKGFEYRIRERLTKEILEGMPAFLNDVEAVMALCEKRACPPYLLKFLMMRVGQLVEGALKLHFIAAAVPSKGSSTLHSCFEIVGHRPRMYDHDLLRLHDLMKDRLHLDDEMKARLIRFSGYSTWSRYGGEPSEPMLDFLRTASLLYRNFHSDEDLKALDSLGFKTPFRETLQSLQKEKVIPEIKALMAYVHQLLLQSTSSL